MTVAAVIVAVLCVAGAAHGDEQSRESYVATVEPICQRDREAGERILSGTSDNIKAGKLALAGRELIRASERFGTTIREIVAVPRPAADEARLQKWIGFLRIVMERIRKTGKFYKEGKRLKATHESIGVERSGNAANNVSFVFHFRYCRLSRSRFS